MKITPGCAPFVRVCGRDGDPLFVQSVKGGVAVILGPKTSNGPYAVTLDPSEWEQVLGVVRALMTVRIRGRNDTPKPVVLYAGQWTFSVAYDNWADPYEQGVCFEIHSVDYRDYASASIEYGYLGPLLSVAPGRGE